MIYGNWVPIHKGFVKFLPVDRPYGEHEAMLSLSVDYDNNRPVSVVGYASLWQWSRTKVKAFFERYGIEIVYKNDTKKMQKQKGQIKKQKEDRNETEKGQIRFIDSKASQVQKDRKKTEKEQKKDRRKDTTIDPNIILDPDPPEQQNKFADDSTEMKIAKYFHSILLKSNPKQKEPNWQNWCKDIDLFLRKVEPSREDIKLVIDWAHDPANETDKFSWIPNLRSPKKLREHFEKILLQAKRSPRQRTSQADYFEQLLNESDDITLSENDYGPAE